MEHLKTTSKYAIQKVMASSAEGYSESCCICDEKFHSDFELANHLVAHANEKKFKSSLIKFEQKHLAIEQRKSGFFMGQSMKPLRERSKSPEVVELTSDESDDESGRNKKQTISPVPSNQVKAAAVNNATKATECPQNPVQTNPNPKASQLGVYKCTQCLKIFDNLELYKEHLFNYEKARPYACQECNSKFPCKYSLQQHMALHTGQKSYESKLCHRIFALKRILEKHEETHKLEQR